jgi:AraC-like DNA-binding protein
MDRTSLASGENIESAARELVADLLRQGVPTVRRAATALEMSPRTFQRRLAECGTSFSVLLENVRREQALARLVSGGGTIGDLSASLGYMRQASLTRAVRRWTGHPPSRFASRRPI